MEPNGTVSTNINHKLVGDWLFLNATSGTHFYFDNESLAQSILAVLSRTDEMVAAPHILSMEVWRK
ncbi:unnamed protein product [Brassica oleracea]